MKEFVQQRFTALQEEVEMFNEMGIAPIKKLTGVISSVRLAMDDLREHIAEHPFADEPSEIQYFKYDQPRFVAEQVFAVEVFTIDHAKPIGDEVLLKAYYEQELKYIRRFFDQHRFLYQYYLLDGTELDALYFRRGITIPTTLLPEGPITDPELSTAGDYLFAKFMALERVQEYLIGCLYHQSDGAVSIKKRRPMRWTGDKSNLIELAYGLYGTLQINGGKVTIAELIEWFEESFGITLKRYYRRFSEIKMRKSISQSKYLDEMREAFLRYIEEGDAWMPNSNGKSGR